MVAEPPERNDPRTWPTLRRGDRGPSESHLNELLIEASSLEVNASVFGTKTLATVRSYQASRKLTIDGRVGLQTWTSLINEMPAVADSDPSPFKTESQHIAQKGDEGSVVEEMQRRLVDQGFDPGTLDGVFGKLTRVAIVSFEQSSGLEPDGICGPITWGVLLT